MKIKEFLCILKKYMHSIPSDALLCNNETHLHQMRKNKLKCKHKNPVLKVEMKRNDILNISSYSNILSNRVK